MLLCIPANGNHELAFRSLRALLDTSADVHFVIYDNASKHPYSYLNDRVTVVRSEENRGFFYPLREAHRLAELGGHDHVGLCHNDLLVYEKGWDTRLKQAFDADEKLCLVGFCGSTEADAKGGRGHGNMHNFRGLFGPKLRQGTRVRDLRPSILLDALFMMFRTSAVPSMEQDWEGLPLMHFYDKIWPCRLWEQGKRVATIGVQCDHVKGGGGRDHELYLETCKRWFEDHPSEVPMVPDDLGHSMYLLAERRFLSEWRDKKKFIPCKVTPDWELIKESGA